jgi:hypothetical protein
MRNDTEWAIMRIEVAIGWQIARFRERERDELLTAGKEATRALDALAAHEVALHAEGESRNALPATVCPLVCGWAVKAVARCPGGRPGYGA